MKQFPWKKWAATYLAGLLVGLYSVLVAESFWNWFAVGLLHRSPLSFFQVLALMVLIGLFTRSGFPVKLGEDVIHYKILAEGIEFCIPADKQQEWKEYCSGGPVRDAVGAVGMVLGSFALNTALLCLGWGLHAAIAA